MHFQSKQRRHVGFWRAHAFALALAAFAFTFATAAHADTLTIEGNGPPLINRFEIEPHGLLGWRDYWGNATGFGFGGRISITLVHHGFIPRWNNSVGITFGGDAIYYPDCYWRYVPYYTGYGGSCSTWVLMAPVALQWNFFLSQHFSVFAELGVSFYYGIFDDPCNYGYGCGPGAYHPNHFGVDGVFLIGGRWHFSNSASLTVRIGYPYLSVGVSFY